MPPRDSYSGTLLVAFILCIACSLIVSAAAVGLRPFQETNEQQDMQKNILDAAGLAIGEYGRPASELSGEKFKELYGWVNERLVNLEDGSDNTTLDASTWKLKEQIDGADTSEPIVSGEFSCGEDKRPKAMKVYFIQQPGSAKIDLVVLPIYGKGLWGTLYGFLALKSDLETIQGITFYQHKETPGLGGEVDNPSWKQQWQGRKLYDEDGKPKAYVFKGPAPHSDPYAVDGLSGATITSRGVTNLVRYWASENGYGPFLKKLKAEIKGSARSRPVDNDHHAVQRDDIVVTQVAQQG